MIHRLGPKIGWTGKLRDETPDLYHFEQDTDFCVNPGNGSYHLVQSPLSVCHETRKRHLSRRRLWETLQVLCFTDPPPQDPRYYRYRRPERPYVGPLGVLGKRGVLKSKKWVPSLRPGRPVRCTSVTPGKSLGTFCVRDASFLSKNNLCSRESRC